MEISIVNTSHISDSQIQDIISAIHMVMPEFEKDWGISGKLNLNGTSDIKLYLATLKGRTSERAFHGYNSVAYGRVVIDHKDTSELVSRMISHEVFEILANPLTDKYIGQFELEVCDPVSANFFMVAGVAIADWVTPTWFNCGRPPYDHMSILKKPRVVGDGGYIRVRP
jgi:hypothetical protein